VRAVDGTIVTISVKARVADDMDVPLLLGSSDLVANDVDLKLKQHLLLIRVYGGRRVDVRTCATQEESRRDSELEMSQIRHIKSLLEEGDNHSEESTLTPEEHQTLRCLGLKRTPEIEAKLREWAEAEVAERQAFAAGCTDTMHDLKPVLFPDKYWQLVEDIEKPKVGAR
jgi:hypothetical protein